MLGNMLGYPFALVMRKPTTVLGAFVVFLMLLVSLDIAFAAMGQDLLSVQADLFGENRAAFQTYNFLAGLFGLGASAVVMGAALIDLKRRRPEEAPSLLEGAKLFVLNIKFSVMVVLPFLILALIVLGGLGYAFNSSAWPWIAPAIASVPIAFAFIYVAIRLYLAWARALATDDVNLLRAWPLTKGKFWVTLGLFLAAHAVALTPLIALTFASQLLGVEVYFPVDSLSAVLTPEALGYSAAFNAITAFMTLYVAITPAFMLDALDPVKPDVADVF
jgi:hypothetical protein